MKSIISVILVLAFALSFVVCDMKGNIGPTVSEVSYDENQRALLEYLKSNISTDNTLDEIINVFEEMCEIPIVEDDLLMNEYGVYNFTGKGWFYYDLVRQYPDGEGEFYQIKVSVMFSPDKENRLLYKTLWSDDTDEYFFDYIRKSNGYDYASTHKIESVDIRIDQT